MVVVPIDTEPLVLFGRLEDNWAVTRAFRERWDGDLVIAEDPVAAPLVWPVAWRGGQLSIESSLQAVHWADARPWRPTWRVS